MTILVSWVNRRKEKARSFIQINGEKTTDALASVFGGVVPESLEGGVAWTQGQTDGNGSADGWIDGVGNLGAVDERLFIVCEWS